MDNFKLGIRAYLLPLLGLFTLSMASCQGEEVIELLEEDLVIQDDGQLPSGIFDPATSTGWLRDRGGNHIGYVDNEFRARDLNGNLISNGGVTGSILAQNDPNFFGLPVDAILSSSRNADFTGRRRTQYATLETLKAGISGGNWIWNDFKHSFSDGTEFYPQSVVVRPGCKAVLWSELNLTGLKQVLKGGNSNRYLSSPWEIKSIQITCGANSDAELVFCGNVHSDLDHGGDALPFFLDADLTFTGTELSSYDNAVSSVNNNTRNQNCPGVMLYDLSTSSESGVYDHLAADDLDLSDNAIGDDRVSRLLVHWNKRHNYQHVNFPIGVVVYEGRDFTGVKRIYPQGTNFEYQHSHSFQSVVIPPNITVTIGQWSPQPQPYTQYFSNLSLSVLGKSGSYLSTNHASDTYCGVVFKKPTPNEDQKHFPVFQQQDPIDVYGNNNLNYHFANNISSFRADARGNQCTGVTFWENEETSKDFGLRRWVDNTQQGVSISFGELNDKILTITTDAPTSKNSGYSAQEINAYASRYNEYSLLTHAAYGFSDNGANRNLETIRNGVSYRMTVDHAAMAAGASYRNRAKSFFYNVVAGAAAGAAGYYAGISSEDLLETVGEGAILGLGIAGVIGEMRLRINLRSINQQVLQTRQYFGGLLTIANEWGMWSEGQLHNEEAAVRWADLEAGIIVNDNAIGQSTSDWLIMEEWGTKWQFAGQEDLLATDPDNIDLSTPASFTIEFDADFLRDVGASEQWLNTHSYTLSSMLTDRITINGSVEGQELFFNVVNKLSEMILSGQPRDIRIPTAVWAFWTRVVEHMKIGTEMSAMMRIASTIWDEKAKFISYLSVEYGITGAYYFLNGTGTALPESNITETNQTLAPIDVVLNQTLVPSASPSDSPSMVPTGYLNVTEPSN